jgi:hypothetical protein
MISPEHFSLVSHGLHLLPMLLPLLGSASGPQSTSSQANPSQTTTSTTGSGSPQTTGSGSAINQGTSLQAGNNLTVSADPEVEASALSAIQSIIGQALANSQSATGAVLTNDSNNQDELNQILSTVVAADQQTAASIASGGATTLTKTITYLVLAGLATVAAVFIFRKK